jgi:DNA replication licensing factor MCM5
VKSFLKTWSEKQKGSAGAIALRTPYLRVVGLEVDSEGAAGSRKVFTPEEEDEFGRMGRSPSLYETFAASIAPSIYGNAG